jgi:type IV pilus assembly protein PilV
MVYRQGRPRGASNNTGGYTLIELLIAIAIFSIGILGVYAMQIKSVKENAVGRDVTEKATWAMDRIEELIALPYDDADLAVGDHHPAPGSDGIDNNNNGRIDEAGETGFISISWSVQEGTPLPETKTILVTLNRNTAHAGQRRVTLRYIKANM